MTNNNTQIRFLGGAGSTGSPLLKRAVHRLSDNSTLVALVADSNKSGVTGAGGSADNIGRLYIYTSTNQGVTWALAATLTTGLTSSQFIEASSAIDSSNNVHITWIDASATVKYVKATFSSGPAYAFGTSSTVYTTSGYLASRVDIDCFSNGQAVVAVDQESTGGTPGVRMGCYVLSATGTVVYSRTDVVLTGVSRKPYTDDVTVSATHDTISGNVGTFSVIINAQPTTGSDVGDYLYVIRANISTGAEVSYLRDTPIPMSGYSSRKYMLFCTNGSRDMIYGAISAGSNAVYGYRRFQISSTGTITYQSSHVTSTITGTPPAPVNVGLYSQATMSYIENTTGKMVYVYTDGTFTYNVTADTIAGTFRNTALNYDQGYTPPANSIACLSGGKNRNFTVKQIDFIGHYLTGGYSARYMGVLPPTAPTMQTPVAGATLQTGLPQYLQHYHMPFAVPQAPVGPFFRLARDSGFTTGLKTLSPVGYPDIPKNTESPVGTGKIGGFTPDITGEASQGTWYIEAYTVDEFTNASPYSAVQAFVISHPPAAANLSPTGGAMQSFNGGSAAVNWTFTDPYSLDFQTAYQVQVIDPSGTTVYDSGMVTSTSTTAFITVSSAYKDEQLQWRVALWDKDSVQGAWSAWQSFILSDPPVVVITSPTANQVMTTGAPVITWTNDISGTKTQVSAEVMIYDVTGVSPVLLVDTTVSGAGTSFTVPSGFIHNAKTYSIFVIVTDSFGMQGQNSVPQVFTTSWPLPAGVDLVRCYLMKYAAEGYVFIGWSNANQDSRFIQWNVYRRQVGDSSWELLYSTGNFQSTYSYIDRTAKSGRMYQYCITQVVIVAGDQIESTITPEATVSTPSAPYWLVDPLGIAISVPLYNVTNDKFTNEQDTATYTVVGVGRHVDEGDYLGANGSMTVELWDRSLGLLASFNNFLNPSLRPLTVPNLADNWTTGVSGTTGNVTTSFTEFFEPAPDGQDSHFIMRADGMGGTIADYLSLAQSVTLDRLPVTPGHSFDVTHWMTYEQTSGNVLANPGVVSVVQYYKADNTLISTETINSTVSEVYEPASSGDSNTGNWSRYKAHHTMPALTDHMVVTARIWVSTSGRYGVLLGGSQLEAVVTPYFDGDMRGAAWLAAPYSSVSYNSGVYSAAQQQVDINQIKSLGRAIYLKTPFGQSLYVKLANNEFDRLAGVTQEFGTMTLPYIEVAF